MLVLLCAIALSLGAADDPPAPEPPEDVALLRQAEHEAAEGRYSKAVATYERLARRFPETPAGAIGRERAQPTAYLGWSPVLTSGLTRGPSANRVDVVVLGDGYRLGDQREFDKLANAAPTRFERNGVFDEYLSYFNFAKINLTSLDYLVDANGREYDTALGGHETGAAQGQVGIDTGLVRQYLANLPEHDGYALVYVQRGSLGTGGAGVAAIGALESEDTTMHEWGHAFGGLADEYDDYTGHRGATETGINICEHEAPEAVPWRHWLEAKVPGVGVYEGADGKAKGAFKPTTNCTMASGKEFCRVCREALVLRIYRHVDPIDSTSPPAHAPGAGREPLAVGDALVLELQVLTPKSHNLEVRFWLVPEALAPPAPAQVQAGRDRRERGPLAPIEARPDALLRNDRRGSYAFTLRPSDVEPGAWVVIARVRDTTELRGERWPWVLRDERGLLESELRWRVTVPPR